MNTQAQKIRLIQQARDTWIRLDNQYDLLFASSPNPFDLGYFSAVCHRAYKRYMRRVNDFAVFYPGIDFVELETQQIAAAVEREAFPKSDYCLTCQQHIDDAAFCNHPHCEVKPNSGDLARHPAGAPVLAAISQGVGSSVGQVAGQGGTQIKRINWIRHAWSFIYRRARILSYPKPQLQQCQRDDIFVNFFCPCPECSKHHDELAGIHHARAWVN